MQKHPGVDKMQTHFHFCYATSSLQLLKQKIMIKLTSGSVLKMSPPSLYWYFAVTELS